MSNHLFRWALLVLFCLLVRIVPHPSNFTPVFSFALYVGFTFKRGPLAWLISLIPMFIGDLFYGLHSMMPLVYLNLLATSWMGCRISERKRSSEVMVYSLSSAIVFFLTTNFEVWRRSEMYPLTWDGLVMCYVAAIPFFNNQLIGDFVFSLLFFYILGALPGTKAIGKLRYSES